MNQCSACSGLAPAGWDLCRHCTTMARFGPHAAINLDPSRLPTPIPTAPAQGTLPGTAPTPPATPAADGEGLYLGDRPPGMDCCEGPCRLRKPRGYRNAEGSRFICEECYKGKR